MMSSPFASKPFWRILPLALVSLAGGFLLGWLALTAIDRLKPPPPFHGTEFNGSAPVTDFTLTGPAGAPVSLSSLRGRLVLLFFGYTNCPDICPTTLATLAQARAALGAQAAEVQVVMVSVDPVVDTPQRLNDYVQTFDPAFLGLSGDAADLAPVLADFGIFAARQELGDGAYTIDHTATVLLLDQQGALRVAYPLNTSAADLSADLARLLTS